MTRLIDRLMFWRKQEPGPYRHPDEVWPDLYAMFGRMDDPLETLKAAGMLDDVEVEVYTVTLDPDS